MPRTKPVARRLPPPAPPVPAIEVDMRERTQQQPIASTPTRRSTRGRDQIAPASSVTSKVSRKGKDQAVGASPVVAKNGIGETGSQGVRRSPRKKDDVQIVNEELTPKRRSMRVREGAAAPYVEAAPLGSGGKAKAKNPVAESVVERLLRRRSGEGGKSATEGKSNAEESVVERLLRRKSMQNEGSEKRKSLPQGRGSASKKRKVPKKEKKEEKKEGIEESDVKDEEKKEENVVAMETEKEEVTVVEEEVEDIPCLVCGDLGDADKMVLCDGCNAGCHIFCMRPSRSSIPLGIWMCPMCHVSAEKHGLHLSELDQLKEKECAVCFVNAAGAKQCAERRMSHGKSVNKESARKGGAWKCHAYVEEPAKKNEKQPKKHDSKEERPSSVSNGGEVCDECAHREPAKQLSDPCDIKCGGCTRIFHGKCLRRFKKQTLAALADPNWRCSKCLSSRSSSERAHRQKNLSARKRRRGEDHSAKPSDEDDGEAVVYVHSSTPSLNPKDEGNKEVDITKHAAIAEDQAHPITLNERRGKWDQRRSSPKRKRVDVSTNEDIAKATEPVGAQRTGALTVESQSKQLLSDLERGAARRENEPEQQLESSITRDRDTPTTVMDVVEDPIVKTKNLVNIEEVDISKNCSRERVLEVVALDPPTERLQDRIDRAKESDHDDIEKHYSSANEDEDIRDDVTEDAEITGTRPIADIDVIDEPQIIDDSTPDESVVHVDEGETEINVEKINTFAKEQQPKRSAENVDNLTTPTPAVPEGEVASEVDLPHHHVVQLPVEDDGKPNFDNTRAVVEQEQTPAVVEEPSVTIDKNNEDSSKEMHNQRYTLTVTEEIISEVVGAASRKVYDTSQQPERRSKKSDIEMIEINESDDVEDNSRVVKDNLQRQEINAHQDQTGDRITLDLQSADGRVTADEPGKLPKVSVKRDETGDVEMAAMDEVVVIDSDEEQDETGNGQEMVSSPEEVVPLENKDVGASNEDMANAVVPDNQDKRIHIDQVGQYERTEMNETAMPTGPQHENANSEAYERSQHGPPSSNLAQSTEVIVSENEPGKRIAIDSTQTSQEHALQSGSVVDTDVAKESAPQTNETTLENVGSEEREAGPDAEPSTMEHVMLKWRAVEDDHVAQEPSSQNIAVQSNEQFDVHFSVQFSAKDDGQQGTQQGAREDAESAQPIHKEIDINNTVENTDVIDINGDEQRTENVAIADENEQRIETVVVADEHEQTTEIVTVADEQEQTTENVTVANEHEQTTEIVAVADEQERTTETVIVANEDEQMTENVAVANEDEQMTENVTVANEQEQRTETVIVTDEDERMTENVTVADEYGRTIEIVAVANEQQTTETVIVADEDERRTGKALIADEHGQTTEIVAIANEQEQTTEIVAVANEQEQRTETVIVPDEDEQRTGNASISDKHGQTTEIVAAADEQEQRTGNVTVANEREQTTETAIVAGEDEERTGNALIADEHEQTTGNTLIADEDEQMTENVTAADEHEQRSKTDVVADEDEQMTENVAVANEQQQRTETVVVTDEDEQMTENVAVASEQQQRTETVIVAGEDEQRTGKALIADEHEQITETVVVADEDEQMTENVAVADEQEQRTETVIVAGEDEQTTGTVLIADEREQTTGKALIADEQRQITENITVADEHGRRTEMVATEKVAVADEHEQRVEKVGAAEEREERSEGGGGSIEQGHRNRGDDVQETGKNEYEEENGQEGRVNDKGIDKEPVFVKGGPIQTWVLLNVDPDRPFHATMFVDMHIKSYFNDALRILFRPPGGIRVVAFSKKQCDCTDRERLKEWWMVHRDHFLESPSEFPPENALLDIR